MSTSYTKKHYDSIAATLREVREQDAESPQHQGVVDSMVDGLVMLMKADSDRFREGLFREAAALPTVRITEKHVMGFARLKNREGGIETIIARIDANEHRAEARKAARAAANQ